jgi:predicted membrane-bound spermidine synthase
MKYFSKFQIEIIVFICGAIVMVLELVGSRILSPYFGNSIFVWTSLIGVMLGFMSLGYFLGGKLAVRKLDYKTLFWIILFSSLFIGIIFINQYLLLPKLSVLGDTRLFAVVSAIILFSLPSTSLGMVSPYCIRLKLQSLQNSGSTVGNLYAISTLGSIFGTFSAGFFLLSIIGSRNILVILSAILLILALSLNIKLSSKFLALFSAILLFNLFPYAVKGNDSMIDKDTAYDRFFILDSIDQKTDRPARFLTRDFSSAESALYLDGGSDLVFDYLKYYQLAEYFAPNYQKTLLIGGGTFVFPNYFLDQNRQAMMDVVEIDPAMVKLASDYFMLKDNDRMKIIIEDGRTFLNNNNQKYDHIYLDAFRSYTSIPYQLATKESMEKCREALSDNGVMVINIISSLDGTRSKLLLSEYKTIQSIFPYTQLFAVQNPTDPNLIQN